MTEISYADWGVGFFTTAVTTERVLAGINVLAGQPIDVGPLGVGPGRLAKVSATGTIGAAVGERVATSPVTFRMSLPVSLEFVLDLGVDKHRFVADITVPLTIVARARADLAIVLDVVPPTTEQVVVRLKAQGIRASITQHAANVEGELRRFVARYVVRELDKPHIAAARTHRRVRRDRQGDQHARPRASAGRRRRGRLRRRPRARDPRARALRRPRRVISRTAAAPGPG